MLGGYYKRDGIIFKNGLSYKSKRKNNTKVQ